MLAKLLFIIRNWNTIDATIIEVNQKIAEAERERTRNHLYLCPEHSQREATERVTKHGCAYCLQSKELENLRVALTAQKRALKIEQMRKQHVPSPPYD